MSKIQASEYDSGNTLNPGHEGDDAAKPKSKSRRGEIGFKELSEDAVML